MAHKLLSKEQQITMNMFSDDYTDYLRKANMRPSPMYQLTITSKATGTEYVEHFGPTEFDFTDDEWRQKDAIEQNILIDLYVEAAVWFISYYTVGHTKMHVQISLNEDHMENYSFPFASQYHSDDEQALDAEYAARRFITGKLTIEVKEIYP